MLQNARVTAFNASELLRENQHGGKITLESVIGFIDLNYQTTRVNISFEKQANILQS